METAFLLVLWFACAVISAVIATYKGRSELGWLAVGFLLGPFGLLAAIIVPKNIEVLEAKSIEDGTLRKCPFCAETIKPEASICKHCKSELPTEVPG